MRSATLLALLTLGCGSELGDGRDAGAALDAGRDAGALADAGATDAATSSDAGADAGIDAGPGIDPCAELEGASFGTLSRSGPATDRPPAMHGDLNLALRGFEPTGGTLGIIEVDGPTDPLAPKLYTMFTDDRVPTFTQNYAVHQWDWGCNCRGPLIADWEVTLAGFGVRPGEPVEVPHGGYDIGEGYEVLVLFVDDTSITLKYTREDNVVSGYTVHVDGVCVDPRLRALYASSDAAGRADLPALRGDQAFGRAIGSEIRVAIRDTGAFMDPRVRKDWW
ncbi:MAG: hypothetical protein H6719_27855 [Sandaracinaceae bacterium]|nr:hypothetical protein [Sandaracinaceae bacterium]